MDIVICGVPRAGNVLLREILIELGNHTGGDYYAADHYDELDLKVFLFVRLLLRRLGIRSPFIPRGGYIFQDGMTILRSRHRLSDNDFLFVKATMPSDPIEKIVLTHSLPQDVPYAPHMFCSLRNIEDVINSTMNFVFPDMQYYIDSGEVTSKDLFMYRFFDLDTFHRTVRRICTHFKSYLMNRTRFIPIHYDALVTDPIKVMASFAEQIGSRVDSTILNSIWKKVAYTGLTGSWKYHYRKDRTRYFKIRDFISSEHQKILVACGVNDLIDELGYPDARPFDAKKSELAAFPSIRIPVPGHLFSLGHIEENQVDYDLHFENVSVRYKGKLIDSQQAEQAAAAIGRYVNGNRIDIRGARIVLYGAGKLGAYVINKINAHSEIIGSINNDQYDIINKNEFDYIIICSIDHEETMENKLHDMNIPQYKIRFWYEVV